MLQKIVFLFVLSISLLSLVFFSRFSSKPVSPKTNKKEPTAVHIPPNDTATATSGVRFQMRKTKTLKNLENSMPFSHPIDIKKKSPLWGVVTTIFPLSAAIRTAASKMCIVLVADLKTPKDIAPDQFPCFTFLDPAQQEQLQYNVISLLPWNHFGRKNIGYLYAIEHGAEYIFDFDDDNEIQHWNIFNEFINYHKDSNQQLVASPDQATSASSVINPYTYFTKANIWPRGFPLHLVKQSANAIYKESKLTRQQRDKLCLIQSLADEEPDVDAVYRMVGEQYPIRFQRQARPLLISPHLITPTNAQATLWTKTGFESMLLPITVHGRISDIWRSFFLSRSCYILFSTPWVTQKRNAHDYLADFQSELPLYLHTEALTQHIMQNSYPNHYDLFVDMYEHNILQEQDVKLAHAWLSDIRRMRHTESPNVYDFNYNIPPPIKHVFVVMGQAREYPYWTESVPSNTRLVFGAYDTQDNCHSLPDQDRECLFIPGTTWSQGRNFLVQHVKNTITPDVAYITLADADIRLQCQHTNCYQLWLEFLEKTNPPAAFVIGNDFYLLGKTPPNTMFQSDAFDAAYNAYHVDAIDTILPYETKFDQRSWWIAQSVLWQRIHCFAPVYAVGPLDIFYENAGHQPYPRGRDRGQEIQAQRNFTSTINVSLPLPAEDYKVNWNMDHVVPITQTNWNNLCAQI
jgi:hypothetical protein